MEKKKVRATRTNGRKDSNGVFKAGHNDRSFNLENAEHVDVNILVSGNLDSGILETDIPEDGNSLIGLFTTYQVVRYCQAQSRFAVL